ncbi:MAG: hypothetical protein ACXAE3_00540 [Candidatus Kariarchaeaceae archaeon]|jgi:hypothetical protein
MESVLTRVHFLPADTISGPSIELHFLRSGTEHLKKINPSSMTEGVRLINEFAITQQELELAPIIMVAEDGSEQEYTPIPVTDVAELFRRVASSVIILVSALFILSFF